MTRNSGDVALDLGGISPSAMAEALDAAAIAALPPKDRLILFDQKVDWNAQRAGEFLLQFGRPLAPASFDFGQIILANADCHSQLALNHVAPFADDAYRVIPVREAIGDGFWQHNLAAFLERTHGTADG